LRLLHPRQFLNAALALSLIGGYCATSPVFHATASTSLHPDWVQESTIGNNAHINDATFTDAQDGWAVGDSGAIYVTHDGGQSWSYEVSHTTANLARVTFSDAQHGYIVGDTTVLASTDSGATWHLTASNPPDANSLSDVAVPAANTIYVADNSQNSVSGLIVSTNNGQTWQDLTNAPLNIDHVAFTSPSHAYAEATGDIYESGDQGQTWTDILPNRNVGPIIAASSTSLYAGTSDGHILHSGNAGATWGTAYTTPSTETDTTIVSLGTDAAGDVFASTASAIYDNSGGTWRDETLPLNTSPLAVVGFRGAQRYAITSDGVVLQPVSQVAATSTPTNMPTTTPTNTPTTPTTTPSNTPANTTVIGTVSGSATTGPSATATSTPSTPAPTQMPTNTPTATNTPTQTPLPLVATWYTKSQITSDNTAINDATFTDSRDGWAVGDRGTIYVTHDGGQRWSFQTSPTTDDLQRVVFVTMQRGYAVGDSSVLVTTDGGTNWTALTSPGSGLALDDIAAPAPHTLYVADGSRDNSDGLYVSTDDGQSWQPIHTAPGAITRLAFVSASHAFATANGDLYESTNNGLSWTNLFNGHLGTYTTLAFPSAQDGYVAGDGGQIQATHDGGTRFDSVPVPSSNSVASLSFYSNVQGLATTGDAIYATQNGGAQWTRESLPLNTDPIDTIGYRGTIGYAVTQFGAFLENGQAPPSPTNTPTDTPTSTPTNTPTDTPTNTSPAPVANTPVPPAPAPSATATLVPPTATRVVVMPLPRRPAVRPTATNTAAPVFVPRYTSSPLQRKPAQPSLSVALPLIHGAVAGNSALVVGTRTRSRSKVSISLAFTQAVRAWTGKGRKRHKTTVTRTLYRTTTTTKSDGKGYVKARVYFGYNPAHPMVGKLTITVYTATGAATRTTQVTVVHHTTPMPKHATNGKGKHQH